MLDQPCEIDRTEVARAVGRQRLFAAGVGCRDLLAIVQIVARVDPVDEDNSRLRVVVGCAHDALPQVARANRLECLAGEAQRPIGTLVDGADERVGNQDRQVEHAEPRRVALRVDEHLDIRMVAAHGRHHGAAAIPGAHDRAAHRIPNVHEAERPRCIGADATHRRALGAERGEVVTDATAMLHRECGFLEALEDAVHVVRDISHDEAIK